MTRWEDLPWDERILQLDLTDEEKSAAIALIGDLIGEPWPAKQEAAVPKDKASALYSIRKRLLEASREPCILHAYLRPMHVPRVPCFTSMICFFSILSSMHHMCNISMLYAQGQTAAAPMLDLQVGEKHSHERLSCTPMHPRARSTLPSHVSPALPCTLLVTRVI